MEGAEKSGFPRSPSDLWALRYFAPGMGVGARMEDGVAATGRREGAPDTAAGSGHQGCRVVGPLGSPAHRTCGHGCMELRPSGRQGFMIVHTEASRKDKATDKAVKGTLQEMCHLLTLWKTEKRKEGKEKR